MAIKFEPEFDEIVAQQGADRGSFLKSKTLGELIRARQDSDFKSLKKEKMITLLQQLGGEDLTLGQIIDDTPAAKQARGLFFLNIVNSGEIEGVGKSALKNLIGDLGSNLLPEVGAVAEQNVNPLRKLIRESVGEDAYKNAGLDVTSARLRPIFIPSEAYAQTKLMVGGMLKAEDSIMRLAGGRALLMMLGGYRPSDFKALKIENIDFETGLVTGLELKTDKKSKGIGVAYFPRLQLDVLRQIIGNKTSGLVFENPTLLDKLINNELSLLDIPPVKYYQEGTKSVVEGAFTAYDFRRLQESALSAAGYKSNDAIRRNLTWRPLAGDASEGYESLIQKSAEIERANSIAFSNFILMSDGNIVTDPSSGIATKTHGQFLTDVGITQLSPTSKQYRVTNQAVNNLPIYVQERNLERPDNLKFDDAPIASLQIEPDVDRADKYQKIADNEFDIRLSESQIKRDKKKLEADDTSQQVKNLKATKEPLIPELSANDRAQAEKDGILDIILGKVDKGKDTLQAAGAATLGALGLTALVTDPKGTLRDTAIELALLAAKTGTKVAGAGPTILQPRPDIMKEDELTEQEKTYLPIRKQFPTRTESLEQTRVNQLVQEDAGFVNIDRESEADSVNQNQGFLSN